MEVVSSPSLVLTRQLGALTGSRVEWVTQAREIGRMLVGSNGSAGPQTPQLGSFQASDHSGEQSQLLTLISLLTRASSFQRTQGDGFRHQGRERTAAPRSPTIRSSTAPETRDVSPSLHAAPASTATSFKQGAISLARPLAGAPSPRSVPSLARPSGPLPPPNWPT